MARVFLFLFALALLLLPIYFSWGQSASTWIPSNKYLKPFDTTYGLLVPGLATSTTGCLGVDAQGWISASGSACGAASGGGSDGNFTILSLGGKYLTPTTTNYNLLLQGTNGLIAHGSSTFSNILNIGGSLNASSTAHITGNTSVGGTLNALGALNVTGLSSVAGLNVSGVLNASSTAHVTGKSTFIDASTTQLTVLDSIQSSNGQYKFFSNNAGAYGILDITAVSGSNVTLDFPSMSGTICIVGQLCDGFPTFNPNWSFTNVLGVKNLAPSSTIDVYFPAVVNINGTLKGQSLNASTTIHAESNGILGGVLTVNGTGTSTFAGLVNLTGTNVIKYNGQRILVGTTTPFRYVFSLFYRNPVTSQTGSTTEIFLNEWQSEYDQQITDVCYQKGATIHGSVQVAVYGPVVTEDTASGSSLISSSASTTMSATTAIHQCVTLTSPARVKAGKRYYLALQLSDAIGTFGREFASNLFLGWSQFVSNRTGFGTMPSSITSVGLTSTGNGMPGLIARVAPGD